MAEAHNSLDLIKDSMRQMGSSAQTVAVEVEKLRDLPSFDHGAAILAEMRSFRREFQERSARVEQSVEALRADVARIDQRINQLDRDFKARQDASDYNATARLCNYAIARETTSLLAPLRSTTNEEIPGLPRTVGDIERLSVAQMRQLLRAYGLEEGGSPDEKLKRFKRHIGVFYF